MSVLLVDSDSITRYVLSYQHLITLLLTFEVIRHYNSIISEIIM
jgi:hypothetical protein